MNQDEIKYGNLLPIIQKAAEDVARQVVQEMLNSEQYGVPTVSDHHHNNLDVSQIGIDGTTFTFPLPATGDGNPTTAGVVNPGLLGNQSVGQGPQIVGYGNLVQSNQSKTFGNFYTIPIPVIYGHGTGGDSQFNGGDAPQGTIVYFNNPGTVSKLYIKLIDETWGEVG